MAMAVERPGMTGKVPWYYNPAIRGAVFQAALLVLVVFLIYEATTNAITNMERAHIASGFGFLGNIAGFDISQRPIEYSATSSYGRAFLVGLINTLIVSAIGIVLATVIGFGVGIARLSTNWLVAKIATVYVEFLRNIPLLLQLLFWYGAVLKPLPGPRQSVQIFAPTVGWPSVAALAVAAVLALAGYGASTGASRLSPGSVPRSVTRILGYLAMAVALFVALFFSGFIKGSDAPYAFLNNRGLYFPAFDILPGGGLVFAALAVGVAGAIVFAVWANRRQMATGLRPPVLRASLGLIVGVPVLAAIATGVPFAVALPELKGFNMVGGFQLAPEFAALLLGLSTYTAAFIAEIVRGGIRGVAHGQTEAARAVGLTNGQTMRLVVVPQAMRIIVPPLTNQYLNLVKNSSLAVAIGYPDLVQIFAGTVLNQTGQAIECIFITMAVYLAISLLISLFMNWFNRRVALVER